MATEKLVVVTGATGKQGGSTLKHLLNKGFKLRGMTRKPDGEAAKALATQGVEIVAGDFDDADSLARAVAGAWGVFAMQNTWEAGVEKEEEQGKRLATVARKQDVQHFVYASVGSAHKNTGIPHFDNKFRVEQTVKQLGFPSYTILRPVFFMENLPSPWFLQGDKLMTAMAPTTKLQMIAADDVGHFHAQAFIEAEKFKGAEIDLAGDSATMVEAAAAVSKLVGRPIDYQPIPIEAVRQNSDDFAKMLEWFEAVGYSADISALPKQFGFKPMTMNDWVARQR